MSLMALSPRSARVSIALSRRLAARAASKLGDYAFYAFGAAFICLVWLSVWQVVNIQSRAVENDIRQEVANLALAVEQNIARTAQELDRTIKFLRQTHDRSGDVAPWQSLVKDDYTVNDQSVQIAIIDRRGMMITSSAMLWPSSPVDLSDREHYIVHARSGGADNLFISKPVLGRASGKWSVQFTRPFWTPTGEFDGVIVVSLDPENLSRIYEDLRLGSGYGLAVTGDDGRVRAGSGLYSDMMGRELPAVAALAVPDHAGVATFGVGQREFVLVKRKVTGFPLEVSLIADQTTRLRNLTLSRRVYVGGAFVLTILSLAGMGYSARARTRYEIRISSLARQDSLTRLPNRLAFGEIVRAASRKFDSGSMFALHLVDLDGFKTVNDTYGHPAGDLLLQAVGERLRDNLRAGDTLARLGGDEFAILQPLTKYEDARPLAERVCRVLAQPFTLDHLTVVIGGSVGIALGPGDSDQPLELMRQADLALYEAKAAGRGVYRYFETSMNAAAQSRRALKDGLATALRDGDLEVYFQPIVDATTCEVNKFEALIRWNDKTRGMIYPSEFIPVAEETGMIVPMGDFVLRESCLAIAKIPGNIGVSVNCSPLQIKSPDFLEKVAVALDESGLARDRLTLEITETTLMQNDAGTMRALETLREWGVHLSMDDFGTGYSSLSYLLRYPITCVKIDRSFVGSLGSAHDRGSAILRAIISLANTLDMTIVAEGVENIKQLEILRELGCQEAQGYYFGRPEPIVAALARLPTAVRPAA